MGRQIYLYCLMALFAQVVYAGYSQKELFIISWGNLPNQFEVSRPCINYNQIDSTDYIEPGRGPNNAFIDRYGNIILSSFYPQIKGFNSSGNLLFSYSSAEIPNFRQIYSGDHTDLFVDSNLQLYIVQDYSPYATIMTYSGELVQKFYPFPDSNNSHISQFRWNPNGILGFKEKQYGWISFINGEFSRSGIIGMLASNGYFYRAYNNEDYPHMLFIGKFADVDSFGSPGYKYIKSIELDMGACDTLYDANEIPGGDGSKVYVLAIIDSCETGYNMIWEYDLDFNRIDQLRFPPDEGPYLDSPDPAIGPDGSIYEFRALDDGLHVIKWTKQ